MRRHFAASSLKSKRYPPPHEAAQPKEGANRYESSRVGSKNVASVVTEADDAKLRSMHDAIPMLINMAIGDNLMRNRCRHCQAAEDQLTSLNDTNFASEHCSGSVLEDCSDP